jgi:hypothetical protein
MRMANARHPYRPLIIDVRKEQLMPGRAPGSLPELLLENMAGSASPSYHVIPWLKELLQVGSCRKLCPAFLALGSW